MSIFNVEQWSYNHFANGLFGDSRRTDRVIEVAADIARCSGKSIALSCRDNETKVEGAYRLIGNDKISPEVIRASGFQHTAELAQPYA